MRKFVFSSWVSTGLAILLALCLQLAALPAVAQDIQISGQVKGVSQKAKTIQVQTSDGPRMVLFDSDTEGMEHVKEGEAAIFTVEQVGNDRIARKIAPKLAKLPEGVKEISTEEVARLVAQGPAKGGYYLVDSRPAQRYAEGHIPTAVSIPVPRLEKTGAMLLPEDKDRLLIFYCGGPT
ncbi:rhodanese-like domain-containing protein [Geoalkalibacter subterraneus]|uniref:rhodanese-like domain-containing protein n=1 Tax=Geoalkalibacter subterraneus TaxID=483547 RepID=UPI0006936607|nr:rhodanese-like domain-containing protein [Geoalkalibacter subterraneus]